MRRLCWSLMVLAAGCAGRGGAWPSLARRPIEGPPVGAANARCATAIPSCAPPPVAATESPPPARTAPVAIDDVAARLSVIDHDLIDAAARLAAARASATAAATAARGAKRDSDPAAKAEIERTALDRVGNQISDIRTRLDAIAGTLAAASAGGGDIAAPLATTGRLVARAIALQAEYAASAATLH